jgi:hypothetical protein
MNPYKEAWMAHAGMIYDRKSHETNTERPGLMELSKSYVKKEARDAIVTAAVIGVATHAAQSQISGPIGIGLRVTGRVALRAIPIIGTAYAVYSLYDYLTD